MADIPLDLPAAPAGPDAGWVVRLALRFGVGVGVLCALWMLGLQLSGNNPFGPKQLLGLALVPLAALGSQLALRRALHPAEPGMSRSLTVGILTVVLAAAVSGSSAFGLANGVGEAVLARNRRETAEIFRAQYQAMPKGKRNAQQEQDQLALLARQTKGDLGWSTFQSALAMGFFLALPGGIFFRK